MRIFLSVLTVILLSGVSGKIGGPKLFAESFTIQDYDVTVNMNGDSSFHVEETVLVKFDEPRHGIFRFIPYLYHIKKEPGREARQIPTIVGDRFETLLYGVKVPDYRKSVSRQKGYLNIRIGSKDLLVDGDKEYRISYNVYGEIARFSGRQEFYYNLIGDQWPVPIRHVTFRINLPADVDWSSGKLSFFTGAERSTGSDVAFREPDGRTISGSVTRELQPYEGMTVSLSLPKDYFGKNSFLDFWLWFVNNFYLFIFPVVFLLTFLTWWFYGKDKKVIEMVQFSPPEGMTPAEAGVIIDDNIDNRDLLSLIFYWAVNGNLEIEETEKKGLVKSKEFVLIKKKDLPKTAKQFEKTMFSGLFTHFAEGDRVEISSLQETFYTYFNQAKSELDADIDLENYYEPGSRQLRGLFLFLAMAFAGGGIFLFLFMDLSVWFLVSMVLCAPVLFFFGWFMPKKSAKGLKEYQALKGFKQFIDRAEKPKLEMLLKDDPDYFDKTLPYAIALGSGDKWAKKFNGIIKEPPSWYRGSTLGNFSTIYFLSSLHTSMTAMGSAMTSMPSRSSSGGFGGGGFSGGGGGGGGGGSW